MMKIFYLLMTAMLLTACSSQRVIVDQQGTDMSMYNRHLAECRSYAEQVPTGTEAAKGAVGGAVIGGALGAIAGDNAGRGVGAGRGAGAGAVVGGVRGGGRAENEKDRVVKNCLRNRGYKVLN